MPADPTRNLSKNKRALLIGIRSLGAGLLFGSAGIHLDLYITGYKNLPTVGVLFLLQVIAGYLIGLAIYIFPTRLLALAGAGFAASTIVGYEVFRATTLFGFHEIRTTAGFTAGLIEALAFAALGGYATLLPRSDNEASARPPVPALTKLIATPMSLGAAGLASVALIVIAAVSAIPSTSTTKTTTPPPVGGASVALTISGFNFHPANFTVTPGESIVVTNNDGVAHTFTSKTGAFDTGTVNPGQTVTVKAPSNPGSYPYDCTIHTFMVGTLTVG